MILLVILSLLSVSVIGLEVSLDGQGTLKGKEGTARGGEKYLSFLGIPYAEPPIGDLRFKRPVAKKGWEGVLDATNHPKTCPQFPYYKPNKMFGSEDCLYINVHTRSLDGKKPVVVHIHGGSFLVGSADFGAEYMLEQDVVFVAMQYRLGPFGFLSTEDAEGPGNYGLHDQQLALKWIQQHIEKFGGNKDLVTITGMSAGGASVHYHVLSPRSDGLFHRAMAMSGSALCWWANLQNPKKNAVGLAEALECPTADTTQLLSCLREKSVEDIMTAQQGLYHWRKGLSEAEPLTIWSPRADVEAGDDGILPVDPSLAMQAGQIQPVPFLVGVAESEGAWRAAGYLNKDDNMAEFLKNFDDIAPHALGLVNQVREDQMQDMLNKIKRYYLSALTKEEDLDKRLNKVVSGMVQMLGDTMFNYAIDRMVKLHGNKEYAPVWTYMYNYKQNHSLTMFDINNPGKVLPFDKQLDQLKKPTHAHELSMMFPMFEQDMGPLSAEETKISKKFVKFVHDFAVKGVPTQDGRYEMRDWKNVADGQLTYFVFGKYSASQMGMPFQQRMKWWSQQSVYWNKMGPEVEAEAMEATAEEPERYAEDAEEITDEVEELTEHEAEEVQVEKILNEMKDEL